MPPRRRKPSSTTSDSHAPITASQNDGTAEEKKGNGGQLLVIFLCLVIDIFAFTLILPLFPRMLAYYEQHESDDPESLYSLFMDKIQDFKSLASAKGSHIDVVLFGGFIGSLFSFLQFIVSPLIGRLSDRIGRKAALLVTMIGNVASAVCWFMAYDFRWFLASRVIGGLSEGNVQLSVAMITDLTTPATRSKGLALVGIAFALGFCGGPMFGAYLSTLPVESLKIQGFGGLDAWLHPYSGPAAGAVGLLILEVILIMALLRETLPPTSTKNHPKAKDETTESEQEKERTDADRLSTVSLLHFLFLLVFAGMEFTLTFVTYDRFSFTNVQNGKLLAYMGLMAALVQGAYVRRFARKFGERRVAYQGIMAAAAALFMLAPHYDAAYEFPEGQRNILTWFDVPTKEEGTALLYGASTFLAFTSGTVVTCLTSIASLSTSSAEKLGRFRSWGQLGRALGPVLACTSYWIYGSRRTYMIGSGVMVMFGLLTAMIPK